MLSGLVTTIIPVHNRPELLREAVASVLEQTYRPIEIIIVDDGSTDATPAVADQLAREHPGEIRVFHQSNRGVGLAREAGRLLANGEFIQYLDSDDRLLPLKFEAQVSGLREHPEAGASYGWTRYRFEDGSVSTAPAKRTGERIETMFPSMLQARWWHTPTPLFRRDLTDAAGPWTALQNEEDWEYDARIAALGVTLHFVEEWMCEVGQHAAERLSRQGHVRHVLQDRARAHALIFVHAHRAGLDETRTEMRHFARELFLLSRQCGAAGLPAESRMLFRLSRDASGNGRGRLQFRVYEAFATLLGWSLAGHLSCLSDRLRRKRGDRAT